MSDFKFKCPHCQQSLEAPPDLLGQVIECPSCQGSIQLPQPAMTRPRVPKAKGKRIIICGMVTVLVLGVATALILHNQGDRRARRRIASLDDATLVRILPDYPKSSTTASFIRGELEDRGIDPAAVTEKDNKSTTPRKGRAPRAAPPEVESSLYQGTWTGQNRVGFHVAELTFHADAFPCAGEVVTQYGSGQMFRTEVTWTGDGASLKGTHASGTQLVDATLSSGTLSGEVTSLIAVGGITHISFSGFKRRPEGQKEGVATAREPKRPDSEPKPPRVYRYLSEQASSAPSWAHSKGIGVKTLADGNLGIQVPEGATLPYLEGQTPADLPGSTDIRVDVDPAVGYTTFVGLKFTCDCTIDIWKDGTIEVGRPGIIAEDEGGQQYVSREVDVTPGKSAIVMVQVADGKTGNTRQGHATREHQAKTAMPTAQHSPLHRAERAPLKPPSGGAHWLSVSELTIADTEIAGGNRFWLWPEDDTEIRLEPGGLGKKRVNFKLRWAVRPGQLPPGSVNPSERFALFMVHWPDDKSGRYSRIHSPIDLASSTQEGTLTVEQTFDEERSIGNLFVVITKNKTPKGQNTCVDTIKEIFGEAVPETLSSFVRLRVVTTSRSAGGAAVAPLANDAAAAALLEYCLSNAEVESIQYIPPISLSRKVAGGHAKLDMDRYKLLTKIQPRPEDVRAKWKPDYVKSAQDYIRQLQKLEPALDFLDFTLSKGGAVRDIEAKYGAANDVHDVEYEAEISSLGLKDVHLTWKRWQWIMLGVDRQQTVRAVRVNCEGILASGDSARHEAGKLSSRRFPQRSTMGRDEASPLLSAGEAENRIARTWTDIRGRAIQATLVSQEKDRITLSKEGKEYTIPLVRLSKEDRAYLQRRK